jgi:hypothetical protein
LLIVDEAQNLSHRVLEEVRMLSGIETTKEKALRIILAGQPELNEKLNSPELVQLAQRVRLRFHLAALTKAESNAYIDHRLEVAGSQGRRIFAEDTYATIYKYTGGVPRLINTLCDTAMMAASGATATRSAARISMRRSASCNGRNSGHTNRMRLAGSLEHTLPSRRRPGRSSANPCGLRGQNTIEKELTAGPSGDRPNPGKRLANRQQIHQPPSLPDRDSGSIRASSKISTARTEFTCSPNACGATT